MYDLDRYLTAQTRDYANALRELRGGRKTSHWMWYIFPQLASRGSSDRSKYYGMEGLDEAKAYHQNRVLGPRYHACVEALLAHKSLPIHDIMGTVDAKKLRSSLTLMEAAGGGPLLGEALDIFLRWHALRSYLAESPRWLNWQHWCFHYRQPPD